MAQQAVRFESPGDFIEIPHSESLVSREVTLELWLRVHAVGQFAGGEQTVLDKRAGPSQGFNLRLAGERFPLAIGLVSIEPNFTATGSLLEAKTWYHVAATLGTNRSKIYVNAELVSSEPHGYGPSSRMDLRIGEFHGYPSEYLGLRGDVDEIRIWDHVRSQRQIQDNYLRTLRGDESGLVAYWTFNKDLGSIATDQSRHRNHGTLHGRAHFVPADIPADGIPLEMPTGFRAISSAVGVQLRWKPTTDPDVVSYAIYRGSSEEFVPDDASSIASLEARATHYLDNSLSEGEAYYYRLKALNQQRKSPPSALAFGQRRGTLDDYMTGVYYYPWFGPSPSDPDAHPWPEQYTRDFLVPRQPPLLGHYPRKNAQVIRQHLEWMAQYGIDFIVSSWWGRESSEDSVLHEHILPELTRTTLKFTVYYELIREEILGVEGVAPEGLVIDQRRAGILLSDFRYLADTYFDHPHLLRINGRPVIFLYASRSLSGEYEEAFTRIREELLLDGHNLFLVGDEMNWQAPDKGHLRFLDGVSPYLMLPDEGYPLDTDYYADLSVKARQWEAAIKEEGRLLIPNVHPGYNPRGVDLSTYAVPRQYTDDSENGSTFTEMIRVMRTFVDPKSRMMMITSWNEWHEDTQIEPTVIADSTDRDSSESGVLYTSGYSYVGYGTNYLEMVQELLGGGREGLPPCEDGQRIRCLSGGRFQVDARWRDFTGRTGRGRVAPFGSDKSGLFWFFDEDNWEMLVKVLDGCAVNGHFWVFVAATTSVEFTLRVTDTLTGVVKEYFNPQGRASPAITDTTAFASCSEESGQESSRTVFHAPSSDASPSGLPPISTSSPSGPATCIADSTGLCLNRSRFRVEADWKDFEGSTGSGHVVPFGSDDSGLFWFYSEDNWEMLVKVLDGCSLNQRFWVFSAATTNVEYTLRVTDTLTGAVREYFNPEGTRAAAITDTDAFRICQ